MRIRDDATVAAVRVQVGSRGEQGWRQLVHADDAKVVQMQARAIEIVVAHVGNDGAEAEFFGLVLGPPAITRCFRTPTDELSGLVWNSWNGAPA